ncbi:hypothetical protein [Bacillus sinesaloumensis]|uniref:hypothetical protein n=1 Tax=Litchfieldia sinesaloumensis TaxID=1926280 RepID=UPI0009883260|nr:hypothetical protein [Bacillus sinesaloumensis]
MDEQFVNEILNKLRDGELSEYLVKKDQFLEFRNVLVIREDFKHFRGIAIHGGDVLYRYTEAARS